LYALSLLSSLVTLAKFNREIVAFLLDLAKSAKCWGWEFTNLAAEMICEDVMTALQRVMLFELVRASYTLKSLILWDLSGLSSLEVYCVISY